MAEALATISESVALIPRILERLSQAQGIVLTTHKDPDGDGLSCALAMQILLRSKDIASLVVAQKSTARLNFLPGIEQVVDKIPADFRYDTVIALDCGASDRLAKLDGFSIEQKFVINIDHHMDNGAFGNVNYVVSGAAVGEIIFPFWDAAGVTLSQEAATCLYTAVFTDTGGFRYSNTNAYTLTVAEACLKAGAPIAEIALRTLGSKSLAEYQVLQEALNNLTVLADGKLVFTVVDADRFGDASRDAIDFIRDLDTSEVALVFRTYASEKKIKINFRSKRYFNVQAVAKLFGGGGHVRASGAEVAGLLDEIKPKILDEVIKRL